MCLKPRLLLCAFAIGALWTSTFLGQAPGAGPRTAAAKENDASQLQPPFREPGKTGKKAKAQPARGFSFPRFQTDDYVKLLNESKNALVRKHAARALERIGTDARSALPQLKKALDAETDETVKGALERAIAAIDPPLEKLSEAQLRERLRDAGESTEARRKIIKALSHSRFAHSLFVRAQLEQLLFDAEVQADAAEALEQLERHRAAPPKRAKSTTPRP